MNKEYLKIALHGYGRCSQNHWQAHFPAAVVAAYYFIKENNFSDDFGRLTFPRQQKVLMPNEESRRLAQAYLEAGAVPERYASDARHVAIAASRGSSIWSAGILSTWSTSTGKIPSMR